MCVHRKYNRRTFDHLADRQYTRSIGRWQCGGYLHEENCCCIRKKLCLLKLQSIRIHSALYSYQQKSYSSATISLSFVNELFNDLVIQLL